MTKPVTKQVTKPVQRCILTASFENLIVVLNQDLRIFSSVSARKLKCPSLARLGTFIARLKLENSSSGSSLLSSGQKELEYQQYNFSLQFCPAYNLPIWLHITSADFQLMLAECKKDKNAVILLVL